jgi:hypothetical protein
VSAVVSNLQAAWCVTAKRDAEVYVFELRAVPHAEPRAGLIYINFEPDFEC